MNTNTSLKKYTFVEEKAFNANKKSSISKIQMNPLKKNFDIEMANELFFIDDMMTIRTEIIRNDTMLCHFKH